MRAILLLTLVTAGCGGKASNVLEFDLSVNAPAAAAVVVDGTQNLPPVGGQYARGYPTLEEAMKATGTIETREADGTVRASTSYAFGTYCTTHTPLMREIQRFIETADQNGMPALVLDNIECVQTDGTGVIVPP